MSRKIDEFDEKSEELDGFISLLRFLGVGVHWLWYVAWYDDDNQKRVLMNGVQSGVKKVRSLLGLYYRLRDDEEQAFYWYKEGAKRGDEGAMEDLVQMYETGFGSTKPNGKKMIYWLEKLAALDWRSKADRGNAMVKIGQVYHRGLYGVLCDREKALEWYRKAEVFDHKDALCGLGELCGEGYIEGATFLTRMKYYEKAAKKGSCEACTQLGILYHYGYGEFVVDYQQAIQWYKKGARHNKDAMFELGNIYLFGGNRVEKDVKEAVIWYEKAAEYDHDKAMMQLGKIYHYEDGWKNYWAALYWYEKAFFCSNKEAKIFLKLAEHEYLKQKQFFKGSIEEHVEKIVSLR